MRIFLNCRDKPIGTIRGIARLKQLDVADVILLRKVVINGNGEDMRLIICYDYSKLEFEKPNIVKNRDKQRIGTYQDVRLDCEEVRVITLADYYA